MRLQYIQTDQINTADTSFQITFAPQLNGLKSSIKEIGIIAPVHLRHLTDGAYQIVSGYKRLLALKELGRQTVPALVYEPDDLSPTQAFLYNLHENALTRGLNIIEKCIAVTRLINTYGITEEQAVKQYLPLMEEEPSYKILHQFLSLNQLIEPMKQHVIEKGLALSAAARMAEFTPSTQTALLDVLRHINASTGKLNELLFLIREISARDGVSVEEVLNRYQLLAIVADSAIAAPEKVKALRQALKNVHLPELTERQHHLAELIQSLELPDSARLIADPYFEDPALKLEYEFSAPEELQVLISKVQEAFSKHQWQKLFEWYKA